ncbi:MAG: methylated-DNA--[protein]-cysteine S-methyltransferase [Betaproteobacteria bacterium]|nr:MAG: methylated-DNA--[protein]-cysteine S-methyltransferase [Betaproteobacteria bacterium]
MQTLSHRARAYLDARRGERVTLQQLALAVGASPFHLQRRFKQAFGLSPGDYQRETRLEEAKKHLANGRRVTDALFEAGYGSVSRFYEKAAGRLGMAAREYRARGRGLRIAYTSFDSPLGKVLLAATERGLCSVKLGDDAERLLAQEFSEAERVRDPQALTAARQAVLEFLKGDGSLARLPLDVRGTAFQRKVWEALRRIPQGETRSYQQIARAIGSPRAVRAVGSACGANPVALVIPCHRALRSDGGLGGYAWGLERKRRLLAIEKRTQK